MMLEVNLLNLESLIQETAKKVLATIGESSQTKSTELPKTESRDSRLVTVIDGSGVGLNHALEELQTMAAAGICHQVVLTKSIDPTKLSLSGFEVIAPRAIVEVAEDCLIYIPYLSIGLAAKIANLFADEAALRILTKGIIRQQKIFIGRSELEILLADKRCLSFGLSQRLKEYQRLIKSYGLSVVKDSQQVVNACNALHSVSLATQKLKQQLAEPQKTNANCTVGSTGCLACGQCVSLNQAGVNNLIDSGAERVSASPGLSEVSNKLAGMIDHTQLKPNTTEADITKLCTEARKYRFASVCVNPSYVEHAAKLLQGSTVKVCTVIGFPLGATTSTTKALETRDAIANGATEIDMVINVGALKSGNNALVKKDIEAVVAAAKGQAIVKVILETSLLTDEEKVRACLLCKYADADYVKTATGFGPGGATVEDIALMRKTVGAEMGVKASGGIRDFDAAQAMIKAGASRIGASASVSIVKGSKSNQQGY